MGRKWSIPPGTLHSPHCRMARDPFHLTASNTSRQTRTIASNRVAQGDRISERAWLYPTELCRLNQPHFATPPTTLATRLNLTHILNSFWQCRATQSLESIFQPLHLSSHGQMHSAEVCLSQLRSGCSPLLINRASLLRLIRPTLYQTIDNVNDLDIASETCSETEELRQI